MPAPIVKVKRDGIISGDEEENLIIGGLKIEIIPAWKWLLSADRYGNL